MDTYELGGTAGASCDHFRCVEETFLDCTESRSALATSHSGPLAVLTLATKGGFNVQASGFWMLFQLDYGAIGKDICDQVFTSFRWSHNFPSSAGLGLGWSERVLSAQIRKHSVSGVCRCRASPGLAFRPSGWCGCSFKLVFCSLD